MLSGVRGSRLLDRRPPHYRCPAVPGPKTSTRAILMALGSSVLSPWMNYLSSENCVLLVAYHSATLRQPAPSPVLHLLWLRTPLPNLPARAPAADAFTEEPLTNALLVLRTALTELHLRYCSRRPLITAGTRSGRQSRRRPATTLASELHHRTVLRTATAVLLAGSSSLPGLTRSRLREKP